MAKPKPQKVEQVAALCYRIRKNKTHQILLVTTRGAKRWILPKGWPMKGKSRAEAAAQEAFEEAGAIGRMLKADVGSYEYLNEVDKNGSIADAACVFPLKIKKLSNKYKEKGQRTRRWFSPKKAARMVKEPELKKLIRSFTPSEVSGLKKKTIKIKPH